MSIQSRRGNYGDFDKSKMLAGEFAVVLQDDPDTSDGKAAYIAFSPGSAKRLMTAEDARDIINNGIEAATQDVVDAITDATAQDVADAQAAQEAAEEAAEEAGQILSNKADINGSYPNLAAGQLLSKNYTEVKVPYHFKATKPDASADIGDREYLDIVGGSVGWNQLCDESKFVNSLGISATITNHRILAQGQLSGGGNYFLSQRNDSVPTTLIYGHKYLFSGVNNASGLSCYIYDGTLVQGLNFTNAKAVIFSSTVNGTCQIYFNRSNAGSIDLDCIPQLSDLTLLLGSTIADYIYTLETATAGAGVAKLKSWGFFTKDYYAYDAGSLKSVEGLVAHETTGFNQFDKSTATDGKYVTASMEEVVSASYGHSAIISVFPSTKYYMTGYGGAGIYSVLALDADKNPISNYYGGAAKTEPFDCTLPNNCYYVILNYLLNQKDTVCFNLSWSGYRNGEYQPYVKHSYPLDSSLTLRGIPKKDSDGNLYFDGDTYESDGTMTRKYGVVDLGTLNWNYVSTQQRFYSQDLLNGKSSTSYGVTANIVCSKYIAVDFNAITGGNYDKVVAMVTTTQNVVSVRDTSYTDADAFKASMSGVMLVYELATPTTETAEPFQSPQIVDDFGTEAFVTDSIVPVGHNTKYPTNLRDKLQHLPSPTGTDGYYAIHEDGEQMTLSPLPAEIPSAPSTDGTYVLKATVSSGTVTLTWDAE